MIPIVVLALAAAPPAEDAAHRADRLRTEQLNRDAATAAKARDQGAAFDQKSYRAARARYEAALADWRRQVAACDAGDASACAR